MDDNQSGDLTVDEFTNGLRDTGMELNDDEIAELFQRFDLDGSGSIKYDEFIQSVRVSVGLNYLFINYSSFMQPPMSNNRIKLIEMAFNKMDNTGDGQVKLIS